MADIPDGVFGVTSEEGLELIGVAEALMKASYDSQGLLIDSSRFKAGKVLDYETVFMLLMDRMEALVDKMGEMKAYRAGGCRDPNYVPLQFGAVFITIAAAALMGLEGQMLPVEDLKKTLTMKVRKVEYGADGEAIRDVTLEQHERMLYGERES